MEELKQKIESLFAVFDADEAFDLTAHKTEINEAISSLESRLEPLFKKQEDSDEMIREIMMLRKVMSDDCRAKLILMDEGDADRQAGELEALDCEGLLTRRKEILEKFDARFRVLNETGLSNSHRAAVPVTKYIESKDIHAFGI